MILEQPRGRALGSRALVTGGAGLIGSHITDLLLDAGVDDVIVLDNFSRGKLDNLSEALTAGRIRVVIGHQPSEGADGVFG